MKEIACLVSVICCTVTDLFIFVICIMKQFRIGASGNLGSIHSAEQRLGILLHSTTLKFQL